MTRRVFLRAIASELGAASPISTIEPIASDPATLDFLFANGLQNYRRSDLPPAQLALRAARSTLRQAGIDPRRLDVVVYASTSFQERAWYTGDISAFAGELGLWTATPVGVTLSECGNFAPAVQVAAKMVAAGERDNVLVVFTDRCATPDQRLIPPAVSVLSDGAASCLLSADEGGHELLGACHVTNHRARPSAHADMVRVLRFNAEGMRRAVQGAYAAAGVGAADVAQVIPNNLSRSLLEVFARQCDVPYQRFFTDLVSSNGHVYAADALVNLEAAAAGGASPGIQLVICNGLCNWGAVLLRPPDGGKS